MQSIEHHFQQFLQDYPTQEPFLLALSGGPDSLSLFYLLVKEKVDFSVAHVDHGWRTSSQQESEALKELCQRWEVPFHLKKIELTGPNLEERCRLERLAFFHSLGYQFVLLGHHADDQAETVLKRVFEGARLTKLRGLRPINQVEGVTLLRPLLGIHKKTIIAWLEKQNLTFFEDETNRDPRFLRSRLREQILPQLSKIFGKQITSSLCLLAQRATELDDFVATLIERYPIVRDENGAWIDFNKSPPQTLFEWKMIVSNLFEKERVAISAPTLEMVVKHLSQKSCHKRLRIKKRCVTLHRQLICLHAEKVSVLTS